ncbi:hypothetical protein PC110_g10787 [Phytophthora cactorum]|uniref:Uncharacterized protein n=1 Tax=Phytophthora cactorum TaxID=29920 RepID=A0A329S8B2_9STRA|nr:hypothetical protein PC128_g1663 [Phytophthora cactorum]RAW32869.1 hypothetical protein PC110_g10787 [Phytophthora cactorum]
MSGSLRSSSEKVAVQHVDPVQECDGLFPKDIRHPCPDLLGQILGGCPRPQPKESATDSCTESLLSRNTIQPQPTKFVQFMPNSYVRLRIFKQYKSEFDYEDDETLAII